MCILCAGARWSRRIVAMLPWLIIPFIFVWAFSQFLSPGYRLEITSPRLACVGVLLGSLCWYELIVPRLSEWREKRAVLLRERQRIEAQKAARWRKEATKHCRNCHSAYRDQNPLASGKYMCTNCGHASKKPELHVPGDPHPTIHHRGCGLENRMACWGRSTCWSSLWDELDKQEFFHFLLKCLSLVLGVVTWLLQKISKNDTCTDGSVANEQNARETDETQERKEKAKRKAEEKRLARLERERKEEEERKDREEFKRLVDERSKLRAESEHKRESVAGKEHDLKKEKEAEKKKQEKPKMKEKELLADKASPDIMKPKTEGGEHEPKPSEGYRRKDRNEFRNFKASSGSGFMGGSSMHTTSSKKSSATARNSNDVKTNVPPAAVKEPPRSGTRMSWSKVLCGVGNKAEDSTPAKNSVQPVVPPVPKCKDSPMASKWKQLPPTQHQSSSFQLFSDSLPSSPYVAGVSSPLCSSVSADPIYLPGTAPALPPISAPHNSLTEPDVATSLFSPLHSQFFPSTVLPPVSNDDSHLVITSTVLPSQTALPPASCFPSSSVSNDFAWSFPHKSVTDSPVHLPEDLNFSPSMNDNGWLHYEYDLDNVPPEFLDCFTRDIMVDPVTTADGHSYDRSTIEAWLEDHKTSPITGIELPPAPPADNVDRTLRPNHVLRSQIIDYNERKARGRASREALPSSPWPVAAASPQRPQQQQIGGLFITPGLQSMWSFEGN